MMYVGGKSRQAPHIGRALRAATGGRTRYLEPFVGGGNILVTTPVTWDRTASDNHEDLILMWQALQNGWTPPGHVTREEYEAQRHAPPSPLRAFVGYCCSYGARWFNNYGINPRCDLADVASRWLTTHRDRLTGVAFLHCDYTFHQPDQHTLVYCDPPYAATGGYRKQVFDTAKFWHIMNQWVENGAAVLVSEYTAPSPWIPVRTRDRYVGIGNQHRPEHLWRHPDEYQPRLDRNHP